ncbi:MAG: transposase [Candidatus Pacebacteria bacterium]|nr:transposase [Candidatus Paceibacterota bacterium]NUQ56879.1 transposase [Candidatus Paceibacter sp.]
MSRKINFSPGENYHIYNRGNDKRVIFQNKADYDRFTALLYICNGTKDIKLSDYPNIKMEKLLEIKRGETLVDIGAYCLMPNHFHLLIHEKTEGGISKFMQKLLTAYTMYFNKKNERTGVLFGGLFKATHVNEDRYLKYLLSYIHLNPIKLIEPAWKETGIKNKKGADLFLKSYIYSSFLDFTVEKRKELVILNKNQFPEYFENFKEFEVFIENWLMFSNDNPTVKARP